MKALVVAAVLFTGSVLCSSAAHAQGYASPVWQTPVYGYNYGYRYAPQPYYYSQPSMIYRQRIGNIEQMYGTGRFQGFYGQTLNFGNGYQQSTYRFQPSLFDLDW